MQEGVVGVKRTAVVCAGLLIVVLAGCGVVSKEPSQERPAWLEAPGLTDEPGRFVSAVGAAGPGASLEEMQRQADAIARERLATAISEYTRSTMAAFLASHPEYPSPTAPLCEEFTSAVVGDVSAGILRRAVRQDAWQGPGGEAYVLYRLPVSVLNDEMIQKMSYSLSHVNPFGTGADQVTAEMADFLEEKLEEGLEEAARARPVTEETPPQYRPPAWLEVGRHEDYPAQEFFSAIGVAVDLAGAERSARTELAALMDARLGREIRTVTDRPDGGPLAENVDWIEPDAIAFTEKDLVATRIAEHWHDALTDMHYALAVVDRTTADLVYRGGITEALERSSSLTTSGRNHQKADNYARSLKDYLDALVEARRAVEAQLRAMVVAPEESAIEPGIIIPEPVLAEVKQELRALLQSIVIDKTGGDGQWVAPGVPLKAPLQARITAGDAQEPVAGVPVRLLIGPPDGKVAARAFTDAEGMVEWRLREPPPAGSPPNIIVAELDLEHLAPEADLFRLDPPQVAFDYVLRSRANAWFAFHVRERTADGLLVPTELTVRLKQAMEAEGFLLVEEQEILKHLKAGEIGVDSHEADVLDAFSALRQSMGPGKFLLIVIGEVQRQLVETVATAEGELYIVHCPFQIKVFDPDLPGERKSVLVATGTGQGAYTDSEAEAEARARADAAASAVAQLLSEMRERLAPEVPRH